MHEGGLDLVLYGKTMKIFQHEGVDQWDWLIIFPTGGVVSPALVGGETGGAPQETGHSAGAQQWAGHGWLGAWHNIYIRIYGLRIIGVFQVIFYIDMAKYFLPVQFDEYIVVDQDLLPFPIQIFKTGLAFLNQFSYGPGHRKKP